MRTTVASKVQRTTPNRVVYEFLRLCLRSRLDPGCLELVRAQSAQPGFDWGGVCELAEAESTAGMLYHTLRGQEILPAAVAERLRRPYAGNTLRNTYLLHELA